MTDALDNRWWLNKRDPHRSLFSAVAALRTDEETRRQRILHFIRLYGNRHVSGLGPTEFDDEVALPFFDEVSLRFNAVKSVIDTAVSRIGKNKPKAAFLTSRGPWSLQRQARRLEKYVEGTFYEADVYSKGRMVFRDGCITGAGVLKFFPRQTKHSWKIGCERVFPWEIVIDKVDGRYGTPRTIYHLKYYDRRVVKAMFKITDRELDASNKGEDAEVSAVTMSDQVLVVESWHLPSGPNSNDGQHIIAVSNKTLLNEEWDEEWFPFAMFMWSRPVIGHWGTGLAQDINGIQVEINRLLDKIQRAYALFANPWVAVHRGSRIVKSQMTNEIGRILEYDGTPPQVVTHNPITGQIFQHLAQLKDDAYQQPGISQMAAQNKKPADLESGEALRQWNDIEDSRQADPALMYEKLYMDAARIIVGLSRRMHADGKSPRVMATFKRRSQRWVDEIKWSEVNLEESGYVMQIYPTSTLPSSPAGRTATVQEWMRANLIDTEEARYLLDFPDIEEHQAYRLSPTEIVLDAIEEIIDEGRYVGPEPFQDLERSLEMVQLSYLRAKLDRVPEDRLELLRTYISATKRLIDIRDGRLPETVGQAAMQPQMAQPQAAPAPQVLEGPPDPIQQAGVLAALQGGAAA